MAAAVLKSMIALLIVAALQATTVETLVERLGHEDPAIRDEATNDLLALGPSVVPALEPFGGGADPEVAARVEWILAQFAPRPLAEMLTVGARWGAEGLQVTVSNESPVPVLLRDNAQVTAEYEGGAFITFGGVSGRSGCLLHEREFFELAPRETRTWATLHVAPGEIEGVVAIRYAFSRTDYVARCRRAHPRHDDPTKPWNHAPEVSFRREIDVPPPPED